jgi:hypothetical protein
MLMVVVFFRTGTIVSYVGRSADGGGGKWRRRMEEEYSIRSYGGT